MFDSPILHVNAPHAASHLVFFSSVCLSIAVQFEALRRRSSHFRETAKHVEFNGSQFRQFVVYQKFFATSCTSNTVNGKAFNANNLDFNNFQF